MVFYAVSRYRKMISVDILKAICDKFNADGERLSCLLDGEYCPYSVRDEFEQAYSDLGSKIDTDDCDSDVFAFIDGKWKCIRLRDGERYFCKRYIAGQEEHCG